MGVRGIFHDGNWWLSCSATAACLKPGRPPSLPSPRGGRRESQRGRGSPLPPLFPPPLGEGEGGGRQKRKTLPSPLPSPASWRGSQRKLDPHPRPLSQAGEGASAALNRIPVPARAAPCPPHRRQSHGWPESASASCAPAGWWRLRQTCAATRPRRGRVPCL